MRRIAGALPSALVGRVTLPLPPFSGYYVPPETPANASATPLVVQWSSAATLTTNQAVKRFGLVPAKPKNRTCWVGGRSVLLRMDPFSHGGASGRDGVLPEAVLHLRIVHSPTAQSLQALAALPKSPIDVWVNHNREVPQMYKADLDPEYMRFFDLTLTYVRRRATEAGVWWPYHSQLDSWLDSLRQPIVPFHKRKHARLVVAAASNCDDFAGRGVFLGALVKALPGQVVSAGRCHRTTAQRLSPQRLDAMVHNSFFYLAFENAVCEDWITEKLWRALVNGAVPIVFDPPQSLAGAKDHTRVPGYHKVLPPGTYIDASDFASLTELVAHLRRVAANRTLYESYLWTHSASVAEIKARWPEHTAFNNGYWGFRKGVKRECQVVERALGLKRVAPRLTPDTSCLPPLQLCHLLPRHECVPGGVDERERAHVWAKSHEGQRAEAPQPGKRRTLLRLGRFGLEV